MLVAPPIAGPPRSRTPHRSVLAAVSAALALTACSSVGTGVQTGSLDGAAEGGGKIERSTTAAPSTTEAPLTAWPLTGLPLPDPAVAEHAVVAVKIDDAPPARPQTGINAADMCIEERVEGITRLMCLFHSQDADPVGPIRSARSSDIDLMGNLGKPLLVWSGGNDGVTAEIEGAAGMGFIVEAGEPRNPGDYFRDERRQKPHNLYSHTTAMRDKFQPPPTRAVRPIFGYRADGDVLPDTAFDSAGYAVEFGGGVRVEYVWDAQRLAWNRYQVDESHPRGNSAFVDSDGRQVAPENVVILRVPYGASDADARSPKAISLGEGDAVVLTAGKAVAGRWKRPTSLSPWELVDANGAPIHLTPGRTWVALPDEAGAEPWGLDLATAQRLLGERR